MPFVAQASVAGAVRSRAVNFIMYYVYLLRSKSNPKKTYVGMSNDIEARLSKHNASGSPHTSKYMPWELVATIGVPEKTKAAELEKYFKTGSGHAFSHKHLW